MKKLFRKVQYIVLCSALLAVYGVLVITTIYFTIHWSITILGVLLSSIGYITLIEKLNNYFGRVINEDDILDDTKWVNKFPDSGAE